MAYYKRDKSGQWWYLWGRENQNRQRAYLYTCDECGKDFPRKKYSKKSSRKSLALEKRNLKME
jgi:ribosomal protein S26